MRPRVRACLALFTVLSLALAGCSSPQEIPVVYEILLDGTSSTSGRRWHDFLFGALEDLLARAADEGAQVRLRRIGGERSSRAPFLSEDLDVERPSAVLRERAVERRVEQLLARARDVLGDKDPHPGSDLLGLLWAVASEPATGRRRIVVLSDGQQVSREVDLRDAVLRQDEIRRLVETLEAAGRVPDLAGTSVEMQGVGESADGALEVDQARTLAAFWDELFQAAGAEARIGVGGA